MKLTFIILFLCSAAIAQPGAPPNTNHAHSAAWTNFMATNVAFIGPVAPAPVVNRIAAVTNWSGPWIEVIWANDLDGRGWYHFQTKMLPVTNDMVITNPPPARLYEITIEPAVKTTPETNGISGTNAP